jgi:hypothetical protein
MLSLFAPFVLANALQGTPAFDAAVAAYSDLDYETALEKFKAVDTATDDAERGTVLMWISLCSAGIGDLDGARVSMREALHTDREATLPTTVSPRVVAIYDQEKAALPAATLTPTTTVTETPPPAAAPMVPPLMVAGGASVGVGAIALGGAALWSVFAFEQLAIVDDAATFQDDARLALDSANLNAGLAIGAGVLGVTLAGVGVAMLALSAAPDEAVPPSPTTAPKSEVPSLDAPAAIAPGR